MSASLDFLDPMSVVCDRGLAEYPDVKVFALHPGVVETEMTMQQRLYPMLDTLQLPAATTLYLTSGKADWLSGRYVTAPSDLGELARDWKDKILQEDALVNRLSIPA
ncbi:hypothetical protein EWM64_g9693 [Hericium alpestre]|uniref:Uncharacterized protein n=1 Tax=Hericium alpestre TaxID=135208 RepID=A0A4Y9ZKE0_9AGAM|nr:hypothetical protein EWM64_g9693 [Hericium alpestre]